MIPLEILSLLSLPLLSGPPAPCPSVQGEARTLSRTVGEFQALYAAQDRDGCLALWRATPHWILPTLAGDLEGSLILAEAAAEVAPSSQERAQEIERMQERALWGARLAEEATGHPQVADYASAFVGWSDHDRSMYRQEQLIQARTDGHLAVGDYGAAAETAREAIERAAALGDAWGVALANVKLGEAERGREAPEDALIAFGRARDLFHGLGLLADEYAAQAMVAVLASELGWDRRGIEAVRRALKLEQRIGELGIERPKGGAGRAELLRVQGVMQERLAGAGAGAETKR